jgi:single-stranded-DNA-specific exonuclease
MAPFGPENQRPVFESKNVRVMNALSTFKDRHIRFLATQADNNAFFQAVGFDLIKHHEQLTQGSPFRMAYTVEENTFNGETSIQLRVKDIKFEA